MATIYQALIEVMKAVPAVRKSDRNASQGFDFRGIDSVINAVGPKLRNHGVVVVPSVVSHTSEEIVVGSRGTKMRSVTLIVNYRFYGPEGDYVEAIVPGEAMDSGDKAFSKAMSVAWRTALLQTLALPTDEPDPDTYSHERVVENPMTEPIKALRAKMKELSLDKDDVAVLYKADTGVELREETDPERMTIFTKGLEANA